MRKTHLKSLVGIESAELPRGVALSVTLLVADITSHQHTLGVRLVNKHQTMSQSAVTGSML